MLPITCRSRPDVAGYLWEGEDGGVEVDHVVDVVDPVLEVAAQVHGIIYNYGAYYYGVARHIALTGRFEEPIVWHFINSPDTIVHAPFDYWGCMTSLLLVPALVVFGATPETAFLTMGVFPAASLLAFWFLGCVALPLRYRATQLLALVIFAFSPSMDLYRALFVGDHVHSGLSESTATRGVKRCAECSHGQWLRFSSPHAGGYRRSRALLARVPS